MSMSLHVIGFRPPDERWKRMKAIYDACKAADIGRPDEVDEFFNYEEPDPDGISVVLDSECKEWREDMQDGYEIDLNVLLTNRPGLTKIRFYASY